MNSGDQITEANAGELEASPGQRAFEEMCARSDGRPYDKRKWHTLAFAERQGWERDAIDRPHLYGLRAKEQTT